MPTSEYFWLTPFGILVAVLVAYLGLALFGGGEDRLESGLRYFGTTLQVFGLVTVACGIQQMRKLFNRDGFNVPGAMSGPFTYRGGGRRGARVGTSVSQTTATSRKSAM
jgi:hypothetical protein